MREHRRRQNWREERRKGGKERGREGGRDKERARRLAGSDGRGGDRDRSSDELKNTIELAPAKELMELDVVL